MNSGMSIADARLERSGDGRNVRTPWEQGWRRRVYEQVVPPLWSYVITANGWRQDDGPFDGQGLMARLNHIVEAFTDTCVPVERQEQFLDAMGFRFEETPPPIEPNCHCPWCEYLRLRARIERSTPRDERVRQQFLEALVPHLELVLKAPNAYDRRQGVPQVSWRTRHASIPQEPTS